MTSKRQYCRYCGRVAHRCHCADDNSRLRQFLARHPDTPDYQPYLMDVPYKRGVPPQIKRRERATLRKNYTEWYSNLVEQFGEFCLNCGDTENLAIDHILPIAKGGISTLDNLQLLCAECNQIKWKLWIDCRSATNAIE